MGGEEVGVDGCERFWEVLKVGGGCGVACEEGCEAGEEREGGGLGAVVEVRGEGRDGDVGEGGEVVGERGEEGKAG